MKPQDKLLLGIGAVVITLALGGAVIGGLYWLTTQAGIQGTRWWAIVATLALPAAVVITYRLATHSAREHLAGFDRGLDGAQKTVEAMGRSLAATASLARTARQPARPSAADLMQVGSMQIVEATPTNNIIDL
jgi:hypothetical protein